MARIRTIKPEFFTSEDIVSMSPLARLFYVSLWCESDREGRMEWKPGTFKMRYMPGDNCDIATLAGELIEKGLIVLYTVDGKQYAEIPTFTEHQVINNREAASTHPSRMEHASSRVKAPRARVKAEGKGREGKEGTEHALLAGFVRFWNSWPKSERKQDKAKCAEKWVADGLEAEAEQIVGDVEAKKLTQKWQAGFVEMPMTYLNNKRWEDSEGDVIDWTETRSGVERKAQELGLGAWDETEQWPLYLGRVLKASGLEIH